MMITKTLKNNYFKIFIIILISVIIDNLLIYGIDSPPAWDQGYHMSNVFKMYNIFENSNLNISDKANRIIQVSDSYRGPLTYFISALFIKLFNNSYHYVYLSNQLFNIICIISIFNLSKLIRNESTGILASLIFTFSSLIIDYRADYLIDLSLTSFCILNLFFFSKWYLENKRVRLYSILSGISLGLVFITKPTGIIFFCLPLILILFKLIKKNSNYISKIIEILLFFSSFLLIIYPWFSVNWITIISTIINAWKWGVNYQDGLGINSLGSWIYYMQRLPLILGSFNFSVFLIILLVEKITKRNLLQIKFKNLNNIDLWFLIFSINFYLIITLMSTKDIRFIFPLYPLFCIYLASFLNDKKYKYFSSRNKKNILIISLFISIFIVNDGLILKTFHKKSIYEWPQSEIIKEIKNMNPNLVSTLAILPDTKEINTFNLEAEAAKQGEYIAVRQIISNKETYKEDLKYFDWFLLKTGDQGIMSNESKNLLNQYLLNNPSFIIHREWVLPDNNKVILMRRKLINTILIENNCKFNSPDLFIKQINNGINITLESKGKYLKGSNILIDFNSDKVINSTNISLANDSFHDDFDPKKCYFLSQNLAMNLPKDSDKILSITSRIIDKKGNIKKIKIKNESLTIDEKLFNSNSIQMSNRITEVEKLGSFLKKGEFKNLFNLIGIINQSDPKQAYLKNAEIVYSRRFKDNQNVKDLYSILISQILQRKIKDAEKTINLILKIDTDNGNTYLAKSIINIYLFDKKEARLSINNAKNFRSSNESSEILKTIEGLTYLLDIKLINAIKTLS